MWGTSANDVYIGGDGGTIVRYDGVRWQTLGVPTTRDLRTIWGRGPTEIYAAGDSGTVLRYDGAAWKTIATPSTRTLYSIFGVPGTAQIAIVGEGGRIVEGKP